MHLISNRAIKQLEDELKVLKTMVVDGESRKKMAILGNTIRSMNNEKRLIDMEVRLVRLTGMVAAMYLYMKSHKAFNKRKFISILEMVANDKRMRRTGATKDIDV